MTSRTNILEREEIHEKGQAQKIQVFIEEDQKVSEEGSHSEDRGETETRRKEDSRRDWPGLKRRSGEGVFIEDRAPTQIAPRSPLRRAVRIALAVLGRVDDRSGDQHRGGILTVLL
jgi:hypothetical protein